MLNLIIYFYIYILMNINKMKTILKEKANSILINLP